MNHKLIKRLLSNKLSVKERRSYADMESINKELKKQWDGAGKELVDLKIKEQIWKNVKTKCDKGKSGKVHLELSYLTTIAASVALIIGIFWLYTLSNKTQAKELINIIATNSRLYVLPDSTKVWMEAGSSIQFHKAFDKDRNVWLSGNSLFEVRKQKEGNFIVHINKAYIEVKGTCFSVKQDKTERNEITLLHGKIELNIETTGKKIVMQPLQKVLYNPNNAQTKITEIYNVNWENGKYNFKDTPLPQLIQIINQIFNANILIDSEVGQQSAFTGSIRYDESLNDVIDKICFSLNLESESMNGKTTIRKQSK